MKRSVLVLGAATVASVAAYCWLLLDTRVPEARWSLDLAEVRRLADALPGPKPSSVAYENVTAFAFRAGMILPGAGWGEAQMPVYAYQVRFADRFGMVDAALNRSLATPAALIPYFDDAAWGRVQQALDGAAWIVVTHEHADHLGGVLAHAPVSALFPALRLTDAQLSQPKYLMQAEPLAGGLEGYRPLHYDRATAIAPGVVLIAAAGHTPGSQLVYVQRADGREILFLGDVAWKRLSVDLQQERPRLMTWIIGEDRGAVGAQLRALHALAEAEPAIRLVPGHDGAVIDALTADGTLTRSFAAR